MELFGTKCTLALGTWKLRFVLMLEDEAEAAVVKRAPAERPHHIAIIRDRQNVR